MVRKFFDEWLMGEEFETTSRTITETDVVMFAAMSGDYSEGHTSEIYSKSGQFGKRMAHGLLGLAVAHGLVIRMRLWERTAIAFLGIESWKFENPIYLGDTVRVKMKVVEKTPSKSKPDRGIIKLYLEVVNQDEKVVQAGFETIMIRRGPESVK